MGKRRYRFTVKDVILYNPPYPTDEDWLFVTEEPADSIFYIGNVRFKAGMESACLIAVHPTAPLTCYVRAECNDDDTYYPYVIVFGQDYYDRIRDNPKAIKAVVWHELGHIKRMSIVGPWRNRSFAEEIEADKYACRHVGAMATIDALAASIEGLDVESAIDDANYSVIEVVDRMSRLGSLNAKTLLRRIYS